MLLLVLRLLVLNKARSKGSDGCCNYHAPKPRLPVKGRVDPSTNPHDCKCYGGKLGTNALNKDEGVHPCLLRPPVFCLCASLFDDNVD